MAISIELNFNLVGSSAKKEALKPVCNSFSVCKNGFLLAVFSSENPRSTRSHKYEDRETLR
jgi:hypothetical protein